MAALMGMAFVGAADITTVHDYSVNSVKTDTDTNYSNGGAQGSNALAAGVSAKATGASAVAVGSGAQASKDYSVAIGNGAQANNTGAIALGNNAIATGIGAMVIGQYGTAMGRYALAFGGQQTDTTAEQANNVASGDNAVSFGERTTASGANATSFGWQTTAKEKRATAFGERTTASGANSTAFGQLATASGQNSTAFGNEARANNYGSTAFGNRTEALGEYSTAFGNSTVAAGMNTVAFGTDNVAGAVLDDNGAYTNIIYKTNAKGRVVKDENGNPIELSREKMDARGNLAYTDGSSHTKSVTYTVPGGETHNYVLLQGDDGNTYIRDYRGDIRSATIGTDGKVTVGDMALTNVTLKKANAGANGYHILSNANATVWGENSIASGEASTAFGVGSIAAAKNSLAALGGSVSATATNAAAIGKDAQATLEDSVALGSGAVADRKSGAKGYDMLTKGDTTNKSTAWVSSANAIAVGNGSTLTRQITGVAAGSQDTDAVNVAQLKAAGFKVTTQNDGSISSSILNGDTLDFEGKDNAIVSTSKDSKTITVAVSKTPTFDSATFYNSNPSEGQNNEKVTISNGHISTYNKNQQERAVLGTDNQGSGTLHLINNDLSQVHVYTQNSKEDGNDGITRMYYISSSGNGGEIQGIHTIAVLDDGINYAGDNVKPNTQEKVVVKHKLNSTMDITGGADTSNLSDNNIGVVATPAVEDEQGNITQKGKLEIKLNKDVVGLNTVTAGTAKIGHMDAGKLKTTQNGAETGKYADAGDYVTGLTNTKWDTKNPEYVSGRAATEDELATVSGDVTNNAKKITNNATDIKNNADTIAKGLSFTTNTKDANNKAGDYQGYKVVNRKLGDTIAIKAGDADPSHHYATTNLTTEIANNGDITIKMDENPTFNVVTATSVNLSPKDNTTKDQNGYTASAQLDAHYRGGSLNPDKNVIMADGSTGMVRLHYHDGEGTIHDLATMDDGQIYAGDIKKDGTLDTTGFGRKMNEKTTINGGVTDKEKLTDNNIGVVSNGTNTLTVKLAKNLKNLESVQAGKTTMDDNGLTIKKSDDDSSKNVIVLGDKVAFGDNQVNHMGSGSDGTADGKPDGTPTYNTLTNGANIGDVKNIAGSTTDAAKLTGDSNITVTYNDSTADGKNTVKLNDSITLGSDADKKVTIDGTAGTIMAGGKVSLDGSTGTGSIGGVTIGNQTGVTTTKMDGDKAKTEDGTFVTGLSNKTWNPDSNGIVSGRAATEDQLKTVSDTVNAGWELDVNGTKQKAVTPTSSKVNFVQGQNISISGSGDDVTVATADDVRFTTIHVTGDKDDSGSYIGGITIGKQSGGNSANPGPGYYITGLENKSWNASQIQSGRAATEDQLKQVAEDIKHGTVDGDKYVTGGTATYGDDGKGSAKLTGTKGLEGTIANLHDYYVTKGEVSDDGKTLTMTKNDGSTFNVSLDKVMQSDMRLVKNPARNDGKYIVDNNGDLTLMVQDANGTESSKQTITLSGLASKAEVDKGLIFAANSGMPYNAKLGNTVTVKGSAVKAGHDYSDENLTTEVDGNGNITIKMDKDLTANTMTVSGKDGKDGQIGITGKDGADGTVTTIIKTIGRNGTNGTDGTPGVNGTDGITRIVYQDGQDGDAGTTTHTVATLDDGLKFGANAPVVGKTVNPVSNKMNSTINIKGAGTKELQDYSGKNLLTSVEQAADGTTTIHVLMDRNISADGVTVGQAGTDGVKGEDGEVGQAGTIGINGKNGVKGENSKEGITTTIIRTEKGQPGENGATGKPGVDGKDITRIVYQNDQDKVDGKDGSHTVATLDDGLKFSGDDNKVITKKLNEQLQFVGGADKSKLTEKNIGINELEDGKLTIQLVNTPNLGKDGNLTAGSAQIGWFAGDTLDMTKDGTNPSGNKAGAGSYATGLSNKDWNVTDPEYVSGRAATEDQLAKVSKAIGNATTAAGKHTVVTVNDKSNPAEATPSATVGAYGDYDSTGGNLMIAAKKDSEGVLTYNIKLNDQLAIGQKGEPGVAGKDGKDGKVTVETKGGTTVIIGHDGKDGDNGRDGLFVTGKDGADGVSITGPNGADGTDGKVGIAGTDGKDAVSIAGKNGVGHIGLTGPKGADGKNADIDISTALGTATLDPTKNEQSKTQDKVDPADKAARIQYESTVTAEDGTTKTITHEVATMDDGLKFVGNDGKEVTRKLNSTLSLTGGITDEDALQKASGKNLGVRSNEKGDGLEIVMTDTPDFTKVTVGEGNDTTGKITIGKQTVTGKKSDGSDGAAQTGNYITGLDNKAWDKDNVVENRAATEGQLRDIAGSITNQTQGGGFALTSDEKGDGKIVKQDLGKAIQIKGDTTYKTDGSVEKAGNIKTSVDVANKSIKVELNKDVDLSKEGSIKAGETTINKGGVDTNKVTIKDSTISITKDGINGGSKQITDIASGASEIRDDGKGNKTYVYNTDTNAANIGDVKRIAGEMKSDITNVTKNVTDVTNKVTQMGDQVTQVTKDVKELKTDRNYQGDDAVSGKGKYDPKNVQVKFGSFLSLTGGAKADALTAEGNIGVIQKEVDDPENPGQKMTGLSVRLAKHLNLEKTTYRTNENGKNYTSEIDGKGLTIHTGDASRNITVQDGNVNMGGNQIHYVAPGQAPDDAVNVSQLNATNYAVNKLDTRVNRVGANAAALAALHPLDFDPDDKWDFSAGYGHYKDANAAAVGAYYRPNEDTMFSVGGSFGGGENMVNAGVSVKLGQGNHVSTSRVAMAKEIKDLKKDVAALKAVVNQQSALIDKLTGVNAGELSGSDDLFPDVPVNHWAYEYVTRLKQAGILTGYPDGNFVGDRMMTRYEFAAIVYRAIMAGAAANPSLNKDGTLDRLAKEFSGEMKYIRIDTIRKDRNGRPTIQRVRVIKEDEKEK